MTAGCGSAFCNNFAAVALKGPNRDGRLDKSRSALSGGRSIPSAERGSGLDSCGAGGRGSPLQEVLGTAGGAVECTAAVIEGASCGRLRGRQAP